MLVKNDDPDLYTLSILSVLLLNKPNIRLYPLSTGSKKEESRRRGRKRENAVKVIRAMPASDFIAGT